MCGRIVDETAREIALHTADEVVILCMSALRNDTECVILHDRRAAYSGKKTLLHSSLESKDSNFRGWDFNVHFNLSDGEPWDENEDGHPENKPEVLLTNNMFTTEIPFVVSCVIDVTQNDEYPCPGGRKSVSQDPKAYRRSGDGDAVV